MRIRLALCAGAAALTVCAGTVTASAVPGSPDPRPAAAPGAPDPRPAAGHAAAAARPDAEALRAALDGVHRAGVPGAFAEVRDGARTWRGAAGVADLATGRPVRPGLLHRVGSVTKTFTAAAVMQQAEQGRIRLDDPIGDHLPDLVPGPRGRTVTVRMLLNHTSGIADHLRPAFPSLPGSAASIDENRFRRFRPAELIGMGLAAAPAGEPGGPVGVYSNTNYLLLGELLERVTGTPAEEYITRNVIARAGLRHTAFPAGPRIRGPHSRMYESFHGLLDPPRDYSVYDTSYVGPSAGLVSTMEDLDRFYAGLLAGRIVSPASLAEMQRTGPVIALDGSTVRYGLGLHRLDVPGCGTFWGHDGSAWGAGTVSFTRADGRRQASYAVNLQRWNAVDSTGVPVPHPIDGALAALQREALCGDGEVVAPRAAAGRR
ncbi:serine hydrolase domain-containing protein [Streptomyces sp. NPDC101118]|uniref:serine hydrolase domain-containing protein n=1 Tax=Streptomyces sp. NPDC101118 TaxID=3366109 RepID=UPI0037F48D10